MTQFLKAWSAYYIFVFAYNASPTNELFQKMKTNFLKLFGIFADFGMIISGTKHMEKVIKTTHPKHHLVFTPNLNIYENFTSANFKIKAQNTAAVGYRKILSFYIDTGCRFLWQKEIAMDITGSVIQAGKVVSEINETTVAASWLPFLPLQTGCLARPLSVTPHSVVRSNG